MRHHIKIAVASLGAASLLAVGVGSYVASPPAASCHANGALPDATCTPGATNPDVTQANIADTICKSGWTSTVRPPTNVTDPQKRRSMAEYGVADQPSAGYEYDHLISLEIGGAVDDPHNLWPEPIESARRKDVVERHLNREVCAGRMTLADAQHQIATDWTQIHP